MRARSAAEIAKWFDHNSCDHCGTFTPERDMELASTRQPDGGGLRVYTVTCRGCSRLRRVQIEVPARWPKLDPNALGGPEPSQLFPPDELLAIAERMVTSIPDDPSGLAPVVYFQLDARIVDALMFIDELAKFIPHGDDAVPVAAFFGPHGAADRDARPARYTRAAIAARAGELRALRDRYLERLPAMKARSRRITPGPPVVAANRSTLSQQALELHRRWLARGRTGRGRLVLEAANLAGMKLGSSKLDHVKLTRVDLDLATLDGARLAFAELTECTFRGTNLASAVFEHAVLTACRFDGAFLTFAELAGVRVYGGSYRDATADGARWTGATLHRASFRGALFGDAVLDDARFEDCDLGKADLARQRDALRDGCTTAGTTFVRCDLRGANFAGRSLDGASFVDCRLAGITGVPVIGGRCVVERPDFAGADGTEDRGAAEAVAAWG